MSVLSSFSCYISPAGKLHCWLLQRNASAGQSWSEVRPAVTETTCARWRAGCFNLVVGMGEASDRRGSSLNGRQFETEGEVGPSSVKDKR